MSDAVDGRSAARSHPAWAAGTSCRCTLYAVVPQGPRLLGGPSLPSSRYTDARRDPTPDRRGGTATVDGTLRGTTACGHIRLYGVCVRNHLLDERCWRAVHKILNVSDRRDRVRLRRRDNERGQLELMLPAARLRKQPDAQHARRVRLPVDVQWGGDRLERVAARGLVRVQHERRASAARRARDARSAHVLV
eukprot:4120437-Prymnesium_polylepis.3